MLKIYEHHGAGHWIGSHYVVLAHNVAAATRIICAAMADDGLKDEELNLRCRGVVTTKLVCRVNGDY